VNALHNSWHYITGGKLNTESVDHYMDRDRVGMDETMRGPTKFGGGAKVSFSPQNLSSMALYDKYFIILCINCAAAKLLFFQAF